MKEGKGRRGERKRSEKREGERDFLWRPLSSLLLPHLNLRLALTSSYLLWGSCTLWGTYLCEHVLLPSYMVNMLSCFHTSPWQP